ncbi:hypothetical protein GCM10011609_85470 [Lentzea pudingi]|uniref:Uncharacterized protein n=1 Tax=Lentzea pudingi TaxID=1789439 RepID=A0ABQ2IT95_9PSEU|nr:hypothetical protein [Lentzea pudingi]GGN28883.1 hypothetical protein GCM10011609_85470 [Lentzea pudingi]
MAWLEMVTEVRGGFTSTRAVVRGKIGELPRRLCGDRGSPGASHIKVCGLELADDARSINLDEARKQANKNKPVLGADAAAGGVLVVVGGLVGDEAAVALRSARASAGAERWSSGRVLSKRVRQPARRGMRG